MSTLIVSLPPQAPAAGTEWAYAVTADGRTVQAHGKAPAALLPAPRGAEVVALVPVQALAWHRVELPRGVAAGTPRLRAALEGLLEEQLLDDAEALHLAVQPGRRAGGSAWVAVCDRAWLRACLQALEAADRPVGRIVPEFAPDGEPALHVIGQADAPTMVATSRDGVLALPLAAAGLPLLPALAEDALRLAEPAVAGAAEQVLQQKVALQQAPERWVQAAQAGWDLAQFEFASSGRARLLRRLRSAWGELLHAPRWRPARWGAALLVVVNLSGLNAWAWRERADLAAKREAIRQALVETFPHVKVVVDAPVQMEREVALLRQQAGMASGRDLEAMLGALADALPPGRTPARLEFAAGELRAAGLVLGADEVAAIAGALRVAGYAARQQGEVLVLTAEDAR